ncbi:SDR family NAD(P)-dependent oxidoreductase [Microbacterium sp. OR21]|uniref:SDR family NAD(P)-dependent oxidoreductase n=1 Tax=Microbacterium sp. OR21 TaxID=3095346 RepID=UPI0039B4D51A
MTGRVIAVTGGGSGIGAAVVRLLLDRGDAVIDLDLAHPSEETLAEGAPGAERVHRARCDVSDVESLAAALDAGIARFEGRFDGLVHCAGIYLKSPTEDVDLRTWNRVLDINLGGSFAAASLAGNRLIAAGRPGSIVLVSSTAAFLGDRAEPSAGYAASKGGVVSLGRQLAVEWGHRGIRTNVVVPGVIETPMTTVIEHPEAFAQVLASIPLGRLGSADEVAQVCVFLGSPEAGFVNGAVVPVDGGQLVS